MTLKKKFREFFTLTRKAEGFTLVELIVVIAIMAILSGVAVPAYTGYIKKAETAADEQLLSSLNTAFASACMMNGEDNRGRSDASASLTGTEGAMEASVTTGNEKINDTFTKLYEGGTFKKITSLSYNSSMGRFEDLITELRNVINNSSFGGKIDVLTEDVSELVDVLSGYLGSTEGSIAGTGFEDYLSETLGLEDPTDQEMANAAVLYLAHSATNMTEDNITNAKMTLAGALNAYMDSGSMDENVINMLAADTNSGLASYAMLYATAEAIALKAGEGSAAHDALTATTPSTPQEVLTVVGNVFGAAGNDAITEYLGDETKFMESDLSKDMDAYFQTMQAINGKESELKTELGDENLYTENETIKNLLDQLKG